MKLEKKRYCFSLFTSETNFFIFSIFFTFALLIVLLHFLFHPVRVLGMSTSIFYLDEQVTLSAFYTVVTSFLIGFLCLKIIDQLKTKKEKLFWLALGFFFLILSLDEYLEIHEYVNTLAKLALGESGLAGRLAHLSWIFPLFLLVLAFLALFVWGIFNEKKRQIRSALTAGIFLFIVVLIFELLGSLTFGKHIYLYFCAIEEGAEMFGTAFFLLAVLNKREAEKVN